MKWIPLLLTGSLLVLPIPLAAAQESASIQLSGVPEQLVLPLPRARNLVLTATVHGGKATRVWLARSDGAADQFALSPAGRNRYQINLRDPALQRALTKPGEQASFRVFASLPGKKVVSSLPVFYEIRQRPPPPRPWPRRYP